MAARLEAEVLSESPDRGNLTPKRQGFGPGAPGWKVEVRTRCAAPRPTPVRARLVEVIGAQPFRTKVKRRKASWVGKSASSDEAQYLLGPHGVLATGWVRNLAFLPAAFCRVPRKR